MIGDARGWGWGDGSAGNSLCCTGPEFKAPALCKKQGLLALTWKLCTVKVEAKGLLEPVGHQLHFGFSERSCLKGIRWRVMDQDT